MRARLGRCSTLLLSLVAACGREPAAGSATAPGTDGRAPWFVEEAEVRGLAFQHASGHDRRHLFPEIMGGGAALLDADGDGDLDAYLVQSGSLEGPHEEQPPNRLFENVGAGRFADVTAASGADDRGYGMGVATGDCDGDGDTDLYVTNVERNTLLVNQGGLRFVDATDEAGAGDRSWGTSVAFLDHDADGDLDLFVVNYVFWTLADDVVCQGPLHGLDYCSPKVYDAPAPDVLFRNDGRGRFTDASVDAGLRASFGNGLGVVCSDFDGDGWTDVFVANDGTMNQLWTNLGDGRFRDDAMLRGVAVDDDGRAKAGMGTCARDLDGDGDEELLVVNLDGESDSFYRNDGTHFSDRTPLVGLSLPSRPFTRFGVGLEDFDNDGHADLYEANGRVVKPTELFEGNPFDEPNLLFRGRTGPRFEEVLPRGGTETPLTGTSRAAAFGDVDGDGGIDILVVNRDGPAHLLLNTVPQRGRWARLRVLERGGGDALGAVVRCRIDGESVARTVRSAYSYCAASSPALHLGLGDTGEATGVEVRWVDGERETFGSLAAGETHVLTRGTGRVISAPR